MSMPTKKSKILRSMLLVGCIALLAFTLAACSSSGSSKSSDTAPNTTTNTDITIKDLAFKVDAVQTGSTVTVKNNDSATHSVTSDDGKSFNVVVEPGRTATFEAPGTERQYKFHCNFHSSMHATLNVQ